MIRPVNRQRMRYTEIFLRSRSVLLVIQYVKFMKN